MILISPLAFPRLRSLQTKRPPKYFQKHYVREIWKGNKICAKIYLLPIGLTFNHFWSHPVGSPWYLRETIVSYHVHRIHGNLSNVWGTQYQFHSPPAKVFLIRSPSSPFTLAANPKSVTFTRPSWSARLKTLFHPFCVYFTNIYKATSPNKTLSDLMSLWTTSCSWR